MPDPASWLSRHLWVEEETAAKSFVARRESLQLEAPFGGSLGSVSNDKCRN